MRALRLHGTASITARPLRVEELPKPVPGPDELLVRVRACGICRTDLHVIEGDLPFLGRPVIPGHQVVGVVSAMGAEVRDFVLGERVGIAWLRYTCGRCGACTTGRENLCATPRFTGYHADGGFAEYAIVPAAFAYRIPETFSDAEATPLLCAGLIGYRALVRSELHPGGTLNLYGFGSSAHVTLQVAKHWGCRVQVVTRAAAHRELARELGADWVGDLGGTPPMRADSAILFAPVGSLVPLALEHLAKGGTLAVAGIHLSDIPTLNYERHLFYEKSLRSVTANTRADGRELLRLAAEIPIRPRVTTFSLEEANDALIQLAGDAIAGTGVLLVDAD
ncbi:MAG: zinc-dependent alcohol dehydrogenase family protein [Myxococcota bacterium]